MTHSERIELFKRVFVNNPDGAKVLELMAAKFYDAEVFNKENQSQTAFNCGARSVVGYVINLCGQSINQEEGRDER